eukprot:XP_011661226.1 PREDICTED: uncharacterized protein LOC105436885 [Strongylocentrotus purpuratus]
MAEPKPDPNVEPEPKVEPQTIGEPSWSHEVNDDGQSGHHFGNLTPHPEPEYDFAGTFGIWWDLHCYGLGAVFLLIGIFAVKSTIVMVCRKQGRMSTTKPFLLFINLLVVIMCLLRALYLFVNPYNQVGFFPAVVNNILFNVPFPCMTTCFAMILWVLREVGHVKLTVQSRSRSLRALSLIAVTHLGLVGIISAIVELTHIKILLIVMCHGFFVLWEIFLCFSAVLLMYRISQAIKKTGEALDSFSARGRSPAPRNNTNDVNMNISKETKSTDECITRGEKTSPFQRQLIKLDPALLSTRANAEISNERETTLSDDSGNTSCLQHRGSYTSTDGLTSPDLGPNIREKMSRLALNILSFGKLPRYRSHRANMTIIDTNRLSMVSSASSGTLDPHPKLTVNSQDSKYKEKDNKQESSLRLSSMDPKRKETKQTVPASHTRQRHPGSNNPPALSTDMAKRARLTRKVNRITVVTTVTSCIACILNLLFVLSLFPATNVMQTSEYWIFIFLNCFRVDEIAMACVILYFVAQPMPKSRAQRGAVKIMINRDF